MNGQSNHISPDMNRKNKRKYSGFNKPGMMPSHASERGNGVLNLPKWKNGEPNTAPRRQQGNVSTDENKLNQN